MIETLSSTKGHSSSLRYFFAVSRSTDLYVANILLTLISLASCFIDLQLTIFALQTIRVKTLFAFGNSTSVSDPATQFRKPTKLQDSYVDPALSL
jgi:hypothetical protein